MRVICYALVIFAAVVCCVFFTQYARAQNLLTPRDDFLTVLSQAQDEPGHAIWFYISGLVGGANAAAVIHTGEPLICDTHEFHDTEATSDVIFDWLTKTDALRNPDIFLELVVPLAFADRYPCTMI